jgi:hypothetical protein
MAGSGRLLPHRPSDHAPVLARPVINLHSRCSNACPATLERHGKVASREVTVCCRNRDRFIAVYGARSLTATVQTCSVSCENVLVHPARTSDFRVALARQVFANSRQSAQHSKSLLWQGVGCRSVHRSLVAIRVSKNEARHVSSSSIFPVVRWHARRAPRRRER